MPGAPPLQGNEYKQSDCRTQRVKLANLNLRRQSLGIFLFTGQLNRGGTAGLIVRPMQGQTIFVFKERQSYSIQIFFS